MDDAAAWAVMRQSDGFISRVCRLDCEAEREAKQKGDFAAVPLYRSPPLTEEERDAVGVALQCVEAARCQKHPEELAATVTLLRVAATLRRLLARHDPT